MSGKSTCIYVYVNEACYSSKMVLRVFKDHLAFKLGELCSEISDYPDRLNF